MKIYKIKKNAANYKILYEYFNFKETNDVLDTDWEDLDNNVIDENENFEENYSRKQLRLLLQKILNSLDERGKDKIISRNFINNFKPMTYKKLAEKYKMTGENMRVLEWKAIKKIRHSKKYTKLLKEFL
jgi:DNA-directed RNA polymerase sigma subunit (sigma70/sigma32)